jgi:hypothetical protein
MTACRPVVTAHRRAVLAQRALWLAAALLVAACGGADDAAYVDAAARAGDSAPADVLPRTGRPPPPPPRPPLDPRALPATEGLTPGGAVTVPPAGARHFDPGRLAVGDTFLGLRVVERDVRRVFDEAVWSGRVRFAGEITVSGVYHRHFDYPEPAELCFRVDDEAEKNRIPAFAPDEWTSPNEVTWFCFTNGGAARRLLGPGDVPRRATIVIDDYTVLREFSDVYDTARLVRLVRAADAPEQ